MILNYLSNKTRLWYAAFSGITIILLVLSIIHKSQIDKSTQAYTESVVVNIQLFLMLLLFTLHLANMFVLVKILRDKNWKAIACSVIISVVLFIILIISMAIDAQTLVFMT